MAIWMLHPIDHPYTTMTVALGACAAAWCFLPAMVSRAKWRGLEVVTGCMLLFGALVVCRPVWITEIMFHLPIFRSMRWPFRELIQFQFFFHLFLLVRPPGLTSRVRPYFALVGSAVLIIPMALYPLPPTFNSMNWDRELLFTGGFDRYWDQVRPLIKPGQRVAVLIPLDVYEGDRFEEPYSLLGTYDYAPMAGIVNAWGYSPTVPRDQVYTKTYAFYPFGAYNPQPGPYNPDQKKALEAEHLDLAYITLESLQPLKITLSSDGGPTIDLTPYVPARIHGP